MSGARRVPVLFLDLDDTVRWGRDTLGRWVNTPDDVRIFPEVPDLLRRYRDAGWRIAAVSNQGGVALGHVTEAAVMETARETQRQCGVGFDAIAMCAHHPAAADAAICWCRKPKSGLIFLATAALVTAHPDEVYPIHLGLMVGDRLEDQRCAEGAGLRFMVASDWRAGHHLAELSVGV